MFLLSDYGYRPIGTLIETRREIVEKRPDLVQRFVDASAIGWRHYLYGDPSKGNELIKADNPDITDDQIAFSINELKKHRIVDSGDTLKLGIGAMTDARWKDFFDKMVAIGMVGPSTDYKRRTRCNSSTRALASTSRRSERGANIGRCAGGRRRRDGAVHLLPLSRPRGSTKPLVAAALRDVVVRRAPSPAVWRSTPSARFAIRAFFISTRAGSTKGPSTSTRNCRTQWRSLRGSRRLSTILLR